MAYTTILFIAVALLVHTNAQPVMISNPLPLPTPTPPAPETTPEATATTPPPANCSCTPLGISGGVYVDERVGCAQHLAERGDMTYFCYVVDPASCPPGATNTSDLYKGAAFRECDPATDLTPEAARDQITLEDVINGVPELSTLASALRNPNLASVASQLGAADANLTVFAPTNQAFDAFIAVEGLEGANSTKSALDSYSELVTLLLLHVAEGNYTTEAFTDQWHSSVPTLSPSLFSNISAKLVPRFVNAVGMFGFSVPMPVEAVMLLNDVYDDESKTGVSSGTYILRSFETKNGVVHIIDGVLAPLGDLVTSLNAEEDFSTFARALNETNLEGELGAGACPSPINATCNVTGVTVWAPTNEAFEGLAAELNTTVDGLLALPELADILRFHISPDSQRPGGGLALPSDNSTLPTLLPGSNLTFTNDTQVVPVLRSPFLTLLAPVETFKVGSAAGGTPAEADLEGRIRAYNGMIVPIDRVLQANSSASGATEAPKENSLPSESLPGPVGGVQLQPAMAREADPNVRAQSDPLLY